MAVVQLLILRSLPSNGSTCHNILILPSHLFLGLLAVPTLEVFQKILHEFLIFLLPATCSAYIIVLNLVNLIMLGKKVKLSLCLLS
jgi:hypothetical protein